MGFNSAFKGLILKKQNIFADSVSLCSAQDSQWIEIIFYNSINQLVFTQETEYVFCEVETKILHI